MTSFIKKLFILLISVVSLAVLSLAVFAAIYGGNILEKTKRSLWQDNSFCNFPLAYKIGSVDPQFGVKQDEIKEALRQAEEIWEKSLKKNIFEFNDNGKIPVNLVFDERQAETQKVKEMLSAIDSNEEKYNAVKKEYETLAAALKNKDANYAAGVAGYAKRKEALKNSIVEYNKALKAYGKEVDYWNAKGGAPEDEYKKLEKEKKKLDSTRDGLAEEKKNLDNIYSSLEKERKEINKLVENINAVAGILNKLAERLNLNVTDYNAVQGGREEFETGLYVSDQNGERIDIYQFFDNKDLVLILAHEMGHAIGLEHAENPDSLMYPKLLKQNFTLNQDDMELFQARCAN
jgi:hypothetical protein